MLLRQLSRFASVGVLNTLVGFTLIWLAHVQLGFGLTLANVIGYGGGFLLSFGLNRNWTFEHSGNPLRSGIGYAALVLVAFLVNLGIVHALTAVLPFLLAQGVAIFAYSAIVFLGARHLVFASNEL